MLDKFEPKVDVDSDLFFVLMRIWNTEYLELYDDKYFPERSSLGADIEEDIRELLFARKTINNSINNRKNFYVGLSLCFAVLPTLKGSLGRLEYDSFENFIRLLMDEGNVEIKSLPILSNVNEVPGIIAESVSVFHDMIKIVSNIDAENYLINMFDSCVIGSAICHGLSDKRAIFNWFLIYVVPYSEKYMLPDFIYTVKVTLKEGWSYSKI